MLAICLVVLVCAVVAPAEGDDDNPFDFPTAYSPPTCAINGTEAEARIKAIKDAILAKLHLSQEPRNPSRPPRINKSTRSAYEAAEQAARYRAERRPQECRRDTFFAKLINVFIPSSYVPVIPPAEVFDWGPVDITAKRGVDPSVYQEYIPPTSYRLVFSVNKLDNSAMIWSSDLRLFKQKRSPSSMGIKHSKTTHTTEHVDVFYTSRIVSDAGTETTNHILVTSKDVDAQIDKYETFDVTNAVRACISAGLKTLELEVVLQCPRSITTGLAMLPSIEFVTEHSKSNLTAQLVVATLREEETQDDDNKARRRRKRSEINNNFCLSHPEEVNCCLRTLQINFRRDFGWNWIIAPRKFTPNYCQGLCPLFWPSASMSTNLLLRYREQNPTAAVEPCCVAASLRPLTLLMVLNGRIVLEELSGLIVDSCICR